MVLHTEALHTEQIADSPSGQIEEYVNINGARLWTAYSGTGTPLLLCNGGPGCCDYLGPVAAVLDKRLRVHRWEQRGCGRSAAVPPYNLASCLADMETLRQHWGYERWLIGGHSWGANLALAYALAYPQQTSGVIYLAGTGINTEWKPEYRRNKVERPELEPEYAYPHNMEVNRQGNDSYKAYLQQPDLADQLRGLEVPTLIVQGERDIRPNWSAHRVASLLPHARYIEIADAEHCLWLTHPHQLQEHLRAFVDTL